MEVIEKFSIKLQARNLIISAEQDGELKSLQFKPSEALMLLDILKAEESKLREMADEDRPIPIEIMVNG